MKVYLIILLILILMSSSYSQAEISSALSDSLEYAIKENTHITALVVLEDQVDIVSLDKQLYKENASISERTFTVITTLQNKANQTQKSILSYLQSQPKTQVIKFEKYWIINALMITALPEVILEMSNRNDVAFMDIDHKSIADPVYDFQYSTQKSPGGSEPGLIAVNAHKLWKMGYTGAGRLVMTRDSGVDGNHPALSSRWRGNHVPWYQAWRGSGSFPSDGDGHGTHTMGTITGLDTLTQDTIGIAFEAEWMAADFSASTISSFQWAMNPDGDPGTIDDMPDVISNSWYTGPSGGGVCYQSTYAATFNAVEAVGIAIVFSAGNAGPGSQTITAPKNINTTLVNTFATGNIDGNNSFYPIRNSSSRGPSACGNTGSLLIKPEAVAPGTNVRSSYTGGGYSFLSGTSMACPHVAGVVTLLKQAFPNKTGHEIKLAIYHTAKETPSDLAANDPGEPAGSTSGEDHTYGMGLIDAYAAYEYLLGVPKSPDNFVAYSDFNTPNSMQLDWQIPTSLLNGDTLTADSYTTFIERDSILIDSLSGGIDQYIDLGLEDGREYHYAVYVRIDSNRLESKNIYSSWTAGGSPIPSKATDLSISGGPDKINLLWTNPSKNIDGTPMDDFKQINLYQDSVLATSFIRTSADTGRLDSAQYSPVAPGIYYWYVTVEDNETVINESEPSNSVRTPLNVPIIDKFANEIIPNPLLWQTDDAFIDSRAVNPPSGPFTLNINGTPNAGDVIEFYPTDITSMQDSGIVLSYFYQPQGSGNEPPEPEDSLQIYFKDDQNNWQLIKSYPGDSLYVFQQEIIDMDSLANSGKNFFFNDFQIRFSCLGDAHPVWPRDDWFVDNIYLGIPKPIISVDADTVYFDTTTVGLTDTIQIEVQNIGLQDFNVQDIIAPASMFIVDTTHFILSGGTHQKVNLMFMPQTAGIYQAFIKIVHDIPDSDTLNVCVFASAVPVSKISNQDQIPKVFSLSQNYPNPFNPVTTIEFSIPKVEFVSLKVYDILGKRIATLVDDYMKAGIYQIAWDASDFASGIYYYKIEAGEFTSTRKLILMK